MVDYGCDNGRLFYVLTMVENLSSLQGRKTNEEQINSQFAILQKLVLLCDVLTEGSVLSASGSGSQSTGSHMPNNTFTSILPFLPHTHLSPIYSLSNVYLEVQQDTAIYSCIFLLFSGYSYS